MRLFVAADLDEEAVSSIYDVSLRLKVMIHDVKWMKKDQLHLTLTFIGEYMDPDRIIQLLNNVQSTPINYQVQLQPACFARKGQVNVIKADIIEGGKIVKLAEDIGDVLSEIGIVPGKGILILISQSAVREAL